MSPPYRVTRLFVFFGLINQVTCRHVPADQIAKELDDIEAELGVLEKEGVELERKLRDCEEGACVRACI